MRAIAEQGLQVNRLAGVSMGALMASLCALEQNLDQASTRVFEFLNSETYRKLQSKMLQASAGASSDCGTGHWAIRLLRGLVAHRLLVKSLRTPSVMPSSILRDIIDPLIPDIDIQDLPMTVHIVAVDLISGQRVIMSSGSLRRAIRASMSIPGVFPPVRDEGRLLCDIGVYDAVPCDVFDEVASPNRPQQVIAVDVGKRSDRDVQCKSALDAILRFQDLAEQQIRGFSLQTADVVIRPQVPHVPWFDFTGPQAIIDAGYTAGLHALSQSKLLVDQAGKLAAPLIPTTSVATQPSSAS